MVKVGDKIIVGKWEAVVVDVNDRGYTYKLLNRLQPINPKRKKIN